MIIPLQANHQLEMPLPQQVAIVRSLPGLGDLLCVVPALRALRRALPEATITLIGLKEAQGFVQRFSSYLDRFLEFPGFPGIPEVPLSPHQIVDFLAQAQQMRFDLALQMHGNGTHINGFTQLLGANQCAGFFPPSQTCPDGDRFLLYPDHEPEIWRHLRLVEFLGIPLQGDHLEFPLTPLDWQELHHLTAAYSLSLGNYICLHPGASVPSRRWSYQQFAQVGDALASQGWQVVLTGTMAEQELTQAVAAAMHFPTINLAGQTALGTVGALLKQARLLICNDTGISHLAAALQVNSVVVFTQSDPHRWAPLDRQQHRVVGGNLSNGGLYPTPEQVLEQAEALLHREKVYVT